MSKSRARFLAELLNSSGLVIESKSSLAGADGIVDLDNLPTITNAKLENSSISIAGHSTALGGSVSLDTADISEHTDYPYFTNARARGAVSVSGSLSYDSSTGVISYTQPTNISTFTNDSGYLTSHQSLTAYATLASPTFTGTPAAPTATAGTNTTQIATTAFVTTAVDNIVDAAPGTLNTLNELAAALGDDANFSTTVTNSIATKLPLAGGTLTGNLNFGDSDAAIFGAGSDLQIYHDGSNSYIYEAGTGDLVLQTNGTKIGMAKASPFEWMLEANVDGAVTLYYDSASKLVTTSTGIDVTGSVVSDGLTVDASTAVVQASNAGGTTSFEISNTNGVSTANNKAALYLSATGAEANAARIESDFTGTVATNHAQDLKFYYVGSGSAPVLGQKIANNGDISFYNSAGTSQDLYWDASTSRLGLGTTSPISILQTETTANLVGYFKSTTNRSYILVSDDDTNTYLGAEGGSTYLSNAGASLSSGQLVIDSSGAITFNQAYTFPTSDGSANQVLQTDGSGNLSFATVSGGGSSTSLSDADGDTKIQVEETSDEDAIRFDTAGSQRMIITSGGNVGIGTSSTAQASLDINVANRLGNSFTGTTDGEGISVNQTNYTSGNYVSLIEGAYQSSTRVPNVRIGAKFTGNGSSLLFGTSNGYSSGITNTALEIDYSGNASFAGTISSGTITTPRVQYTDSSNGVGWYITTDTFSGGRAYIVLDSDSSDGVGAGGDYVYIGTNASTLLGDLTLQDGGLIVGSTTVIDTSRNLTNIGTISSGAITATGTSTFDDLKADNGNLILGDDAFSSNANYVGMKTSYQSGTNDYMIISGTGDGNTYISAASGTSVYIRGGGNSSTYEIRVPGSTTPLIGSNVIWHAGNDGSGSGLDADVLDGIQAASFLRSDTDDTYSGNLTLNGMIFKNDSNTTRNFKIQGPSGNDVGISGFTSGGSHAFQLYGTSSSQYGFLDANWASWDIRKTKSGAFEVDEGSGLQRVWNAGNDGSGSGLDADLLDGVQGASYLRSDANDAFTGQLSMSTQKALVASNYGHGVYGVYSPVRYQHVWSMGTSYNLPADGLDESGAAGNLYGLAWTYNPNYSTSGTNPQAKAGLNHQLLLMMNGTTYTALGNGIWTSGSISRNGNTVWDAGNDGSGSGLDADTVDGIDSSRILFGSNATGTYNADPTVTSSPWQKSGFYDIYQTNAPTNTWYSYINMRHNSTGNNHGHQIAGSFYSTGDIYNRNINNNSYGSWTKIWNSSNDGSGSGLDADLLDGVNSTSFARSDASTTYVFGNLQRFHSNTNIATASGTQSSLEVFCNGSGNDAFMTFHVGGDHAFYFGLDGGTNDLAIGGWSKGANSYKIWHAANDGSGSGLDADTLDGYHSAESGVSVNLRTTSAGYLLLDNWLRAGNSHGMYTADGAYFYRLGAYWGSRGNSSSVTGTQYQTSEGTTRGYVYANNSNEIGFLNSAGSWMVRVRSNEIRNYLKVTSEGGFRNNNTTTTATSKTLTFGECCTVTTGGLTITLPASPSTGDQVQISVGNFTNTTVGRNGQNIMGLAENMTIDVANMGITLVYSGDSTQGWRLI